MMMFLKKMDSSFVLLVTLSLLNNQICFAIHNKWTKHPRHRATIGKEVGNFLNKMISPAPVPSSSSTSSSTRSSTRSGRINHQDQSMDKNDSYRYSNAANDDQSFGIATYRNHYDDKEIQENLVYGKAHEFDFQRYQSPNSIQNALRLNGENSKLQYFRGKDGRRGFVSSKKLGGDWVLAQSQQVAVQTCTKEVLKAYLSGDLQQKWNTNEVLECDFCCRNILGNDVSNQQSENKPNSHVGIRNRLQRKKGMNPIRNGGKYYQQDLVLRSQRIITSHTGIMKYTQTITIDQIGKENYCVMIRLDPSNPTAATRCKPFDSLLVHVGLEQNGDDVNIYANGIMKVNRKVVPNLVVFDASGIAGSMAGKGTLWLAAYFEEKKRQRAAILVK